jgi:HrpA-like RNA helicase
MHVKGLNLPMDVEDVLKEVIEPPEEQRVAAAIKSLEMVGALDSNQSITSLGRVLLQLPVDAAIGKVCLLGCFFRCLGKQFHPLLSGFEMLTPKQTKR